MKKDLTQYFERTELQFYQLIESIVPKTYTGRYAMHRYWARKPYNVVAEFIKYYAKPGEIVLDPFCGSGVTIVESLILGRKAIAVDIDPMATFVTKTTAMNVDLTAFQRTFSSIRAKVKPSIDELYKTVCPKCGNNATMLSLIWKDGDPMRMRYVCNKCGEGKKEVTDYDREMITMTEKITMPYWYPKDKLMENTRINAYKGMRIPNLFTKRNLIALSQIYDAIDSLPEGPVKELMRFTFTASLSQASKMVFVVRRRGRQSGKITETEEIGSRIIGYWIPNERFEINAWNCFENRFRRVLLGKKETNSLIGDYSKEAISFKDLKNSATLRVLTRSATDLSSVPNESVDYVFTDPPFGDQVPYLELNALWSSWLKFTAKYDQEIVISDSHERNKHFPDYSKRIRKAFNEIHRVLKKDRYMSVTFYNYDMRIWHALISACIEAGFEKVSLLPIKNSHPSVVQLYRQGGTKGALVVTFRKSRPQLISRAPRRDIDELIITAVKQTINRNGGSATTSQVYDSIISTLIYNNALDEENRTAKILKKHFQFKNGRWFIE